MNFFILWVAHVLNLRFLAYVSAITYYMTMTIFNKIKLYIHLWLVVGRPNGYSLRVDLDSLVIEALVGVHSPEVHEGGDSRPVMCSWVLH